MNTTKKETADYRARLEVIRSKLNRGDVLSIAERHGVCRPWASKVIHGHGVSEPLLDTAEQYLKEKESIN